MTTRARTLPSSSELYYFLEVAQSLNLSRAAERLGISQPSLSLAIQRLEHSLGSAVLIRGKSGVQLTKSGQKLQSRARGLLEEWEKIRNEVTAQQLEVSGHFTLGCHPSVAQYTLPLFLPQLLSEFPALELDLFHDLSRKVTDEVIRFKVDFGIVVNPVRHPDLVIVPLAKDEVTLWTGQKINSNNDPRGDQSVLVIQPDLIQSQSILKKLKKSAEGKFRRILQTSSLEVIVSLIASGAGFGILPERVATYHRGLGLKKLPGKWPTFEDEISLIYRADSQKSASSQKVIRAIKQALIT